MVRKFAIASSVHDFALGGAAQGAITAALGTAIALACHASLDKISDTCAVRTLHVAFTLAVISVLVNVPLALLQLGDMNTAINSPTAVGRAAAVRRTLKPSSMVERYSGQSNVACAIALVLYAAATSSRAWGGESHTMLVVWMLAYGFVVSAVTFSLNRERGLW